MISEDELKKRFEVAYQLYESGDYESAFKAYHALAEQGYSNCQAFVGQSYLNGKGVAQDYDKAEYWLEKATEQGDATAQFNLAYLLIAERHDYEGGINWYEKAAEQDYSPAIYRLGCLYERNKNIKTDKHRAYELFKQASNLGHLFARRDYAIKLMKGYEGILGWFKGVYLFPTVFLSAIKIANADLDDERLQT